MKNIYDKVLFALAFLLFLGATGFYLTKAGPKINNSLMNKAPAGDSYDVVKILPYKSPDVSWEDTVAQDSEGYEKYDIFTPPKIYWDGSAREFSFEPVVPPTPDAPFGVQFTGIERELYRIQIGLFLASATGNIEDAKIQFVNVETKNSVRGKVGDKFPEHDFEIVSAETIRETDEQGMIRRYQKVIILDSRIGQEVTLTNLEKHYIEGQYTVNFVTSDPYDGHAFSMNKVGEIHNIGEDKFSLLEFDFENQTATLKKDSPELEEPKTKNLLVEAPVVQDTGFKEDVQIQENVNEDASAVFEDFFN